MFLYDATGHVGIGSKFNEQGPPAERLDVDGNTKLKGTLFFERPASDGAYAAASGNAHTPRQIVFTPSGEELRASEQHKIMNAFLGFNAQV